MSGDCPEGFDRRLSSLMYETPVVVATDHFKGKNGKFILADPTGKSACFHVQIRFDLMITQLNASKDRQPAVSITNEFGAADRAQLHREVHSDEIISFQSLAEADFGIDRQRFSPSSGEI